MIEVNFWMPYVTTTLFPVGFASVPLELPKAVGRFSLMTGMSNIIVTIHNVYTKHSLVLLSLLPAHRGIKPIYCSSSQIHEHFPTVHFHPTPFSRNYHTKTSISFDHHARRQDHRMGEQGRIFQAPNKRFQRSH